MNRIFFLLFFLFIVLVDQITKVIILDHILNNFDEIKILPFLSFTLVLNSGVAFGLFSEIGKVIPTIFSLLAFFLAGLILLWSYYNKKNYISMGLIAGGAVGNAIDRLRIEAVVDFIDIYWQNWHWPAFNFADISISLGVCFFILKEFFYKKES